MVEIDEDAWRSLMEMVRKLTDGLIIAQAEATAARAIVNELLVDLARLQPDPKRYLDDAYERASAAVDPLLKGGGQTSMADARTLLHRAFRNAGDKV